MLRKAAVFCGENPQILLMDGERLISGVSYWKCTYSAYGEGQALLVYQAEGQRAIYSDNAALARWLTDTFNQHFDEWKGLNFAQIAVTSARFFQESDSRHYYRLACHSADDTIELLWRDIRTHELRAFADLNGGMGAQGDEHYDVYTTICLCGAGEILIDGRRAAGQPFTRTLDDGRFSSSVFLGLSETWVRSEQS